MNASRNWFNKPTRRMVLTRGASAVAFGSLALSGCGSSNTDPKTLVFAANNHPWIDFIQDKIKDFEDQSGFRIDVTLYQGDQLSTMYTTRLSAGASDIDIMMYRPLQEGVQFMSNGWLARLDELAGNDEEYELSDFDPTFMETAQLEDQTFGIPIVTEREVLFYREDILSDLGVPVPTTMEELSETAEAISAFGTGVYPIAMRGQKQGAVTQFSGFLYSYGGDFVVDGRSAISTSEAVAAYTQYGDLLNKYGPVGIESLSTEQLNPLFQQGDIAMLIDAEVFRSELVKEGSSTVGPDQLGTAPLPAGPAGSRPYSVPSWALGINANSGKAAAAWEFIRWATSPVMVMEAQQAGVSGARASVWDDPESLSTLPDDFAETLRTSTEVGVGYDRPQVAQVGRARDIVGKPIITAIQGGDTQGAAEDASEEFDAFLRNEEERQ